MQPESISYDVIVIGSGISGDWAAKELCEKGLKTLGRYSSFKKNISFDYRSEQERGYTKFLV